MSDSVRIISWQESSEEAAAREIGALAAEGYRVEASGHYPLGSSGTRGRAWVLLVKRNPIVIPNGNLTAEQADQLRNAWHEDQPADLVVAPSLPPTFVLNATFSDERALAVVQSFIDAFKRGE